MLFLLLLELTSQATSGSPGDILARAEARLRSGSPPEAAELLTPFLEGRSLESARGFLLRGTAYQTMEEPRRAALDFERAASLDPKRLEARVRSGQGHVLQGDLSRWAGRDPPLCPRLRHELGIFG